MAEVAWRSVYSASLPRAQKPGRQQSLNVPKRRWAFMVRVEWHRLSCVYGVESQCSGRVGQI